ncbi:MAG TPA: ABC transporter permease [Bacilli bacterium]|nr:ABC transporter permease [Bacilli bacterium]HPX84313.1 ABC transporter permease [Bacilli bacterium]HQC74599.1 ABC transporter permease [Bacilli bacterium]
MNFKLKLKTVLTSKAANTFYSVLFAIVLGLLVGLVILLFSNPRAAFPAFGKILLGFFGDPVSISVGIGNFLYYSTPLLLTGLAVGFAFKTGLFNIGASGQFMVAQYVAVLVAFATANLGPFNWIVALVAGILAGAIWGFFPGFFKAAFNINEVITSIMFNWIGMYLTTMLIKNNKVIFDQSRARTFVIPKTAFIPKLGLDKLFPNSSIDIGIFLAIGVAVIIYFVLNKTTFGFELKAVGHNRHASKYAGINEKRNIIIAMVISGALAGMAGGLQILAGGAGNVGNSILVIETLSPEGFNGIPVALLGLSHPIGIIFSAFFITFIQAGGNNAAAAVIPYEIVDIIIAVIIYCSAFSLLVRLYIANRLQKKRIEEEAKHLKTLNNAVSDTSVNKGDLNG